MLLLEVHNKNPWFHGPGLTVLLVQVLGFYKVDIKIFIIIQMGTKKLAMGHLNLPKLIIKLNAAYDAIQDHIIIMHWKTGSKSPHGTGPNENLPNCYCSSVSLLASNQQYSLFWQGFC